MATDPLNRVASALKNTLDAHGYSFHYSVLRFCDSLFQSKRSHWRFEVAEFPVRAIGDDTRIDFILRGASQYSDIPAFLVCECKRPNPAINHWAFVRAPYTRRGRNHRFTAFESIAIDPSTSILTSTPRRFRDLVEPYDVALELRGDPKGEVGPTRRGAIEDAATQALRGVTGLIDFLKKSTSLLPARPPTSTVIVPVVFTTAQLFTSDVDLGEADLATGKLPNQQSVKVSPWLWYQHNVSAGLSHGAQKIIPQGGLTSLGSALEYHHARSIAIVSPNGVEDFLQQMPNCLEDLEDLRP